MLKKFYHFKTKYISLLKSPRVVGIETIRKMPPVALIGGLYKIHVVLYSKLAEVQYMQKK